MKTISINGVRCAIQAYLENDFVNLSPIQNNVTYDKVISNIRIQFKPLKIDTSGKENNAWKEFVASIDIEKLQTELKNKQLK